MDIFLVALNKHDNLGEKPRVRHRACSVTLIIVIKGIPFQNKWCVSVDLAWDIIRTWGFVGLKFAESVVKVLHGKRGVNGIQCGLRGWKVARTRSCWRDNPQRF